MNIKMKNIFCAILAFMVTFTASAQSQRDDVVFKAMSDEINRTKSMQMPGMPTPFYVSYYLTDISFLSINSVLGSIVESRYIPSMTFIGVNQMIGNYKKNSVLDFTGKIATKNATIDNDYNSLRTTYWELSDAIYKRSLQEFQVKQSAVSQMQLSPEDLAMSDFVQITPVKSIITPTPASMDKTKWENITNKLSIIFASYPQFINSSVSYAEMDKVLYVTTTEGTVLKQPYKYAHISAAVEVQDKDGEILKNSYILYSDDQSKLPSLEELEEKTTDLAKKMAALVDVKPFDEYYCGPIMFVGGSVLNIFSQTLLTMNEGLLAGKNLTKTGWLFNPLQRRFNTKVIDTKFTVTNLTNLKEYNGKSLIGNYTLDADGVKPADKLVLVENGILKEMLSGRYPTTKCDKTTGSSRFNITANEITSSIAPGVLQISAANTTKFAAMKKELIKLAKEDNLKYAYIVYSTSSSAPEVYQIDVKTGKQTQVKSTAFSKFDISMLRRIPFVSKEEQVVNTMFAGGIPTTIICPQAIILTDIEINQKTNSKMPFSLMDSPLKRQ